MRLIVLFGVPLVGKSSIGRVLAQRLCGHWVDVDEIRQELFPNPERKLLLFDEEIFVMEASYTLLAARALQRVQLDEWVVLSGTFSREEFKRPLKRLCDVLALKNMRVKGFLLETNEDEIEQRIRMRRELGDQSNIDSIEKYRRAKSFFNLLSFVLSSESTPRVQSRSVLWK